MKRLSKLFSKENSIRGASILLIITLTLSNILGLLRDRFLTKNIPTFDLDIYYASFRIPDLVFNFLVLGAITSAFIPVFSDYLSKKEDGEAWRVTNLLVNIAFVFTLISGIALYFLMPMAIKMVVPSFDETRFNEVVKYSRILMLTPVFFSLSYILGGVLNCYKRFFAYSLAPLIYNASIIVGAFLAPTFGLKGVVYCVVGGSMLHALVQLPAAIRLGFKYKPVLDFKDKAIRRIIILMLPRTISMGAGQIMLLVFTAIASSLKSGSITAFNLANNIQTVPTVILGTSFATAVFPTLAQTISRGDMAKFSFYLNRALRSIAFLLIPSTVIFILLRAQIVRLILGSGKFGWDDTKLTAMTLGFFALSLIAQGIIPLLSRAFYALKNTKTPMYISIVTVLISVGLAFIFSKRFEAYPVAGLALAFSIGNFINAGLLLLLLKQSYSRVLAKDLILGLVKTILLSLVMAIIVWSVMHLMANVVDMNRFSGIFIQTLVSAGSGVLAYILLNYIFDSDELKWAISRNINGETKSD